jgi:hypothetical protein
MTDTLETAAACGLALSPRRRDEPRLKSAPANAGSAAFADLVASWYPLTYALNNLNRCLGMPDAYPFVLPSAAVEKLAFVHAVIAVQGLKPAEDPVDLPAERSDRTDPAPSPTAV